MFRMFKELFSAPDNSKLIAEIRRGAYLVDVRSPSEFAAGTVAGSVNIPLGQLESRLEKFRGKKRIVVFCRTGGRSGQAKSILERNGITDVINGGSWQNVASALDGKK